MRIPNNSKSTCYVEKEKCSEVVGTTCQSSLKGHGRAKQGKAGGEDELAMPETLPCTGSAVVGLVPAKGRSVGLAEEFEVAFPEAIVVEDSDVATSPIHHQPALFLLHQQIDANAVPVCAEGGRSLVPGDWPEVAPEVADSQLVATAPFFAIIRESILIQSQLGAQVVPAFENNTRLLVINPVDLLQNELF
jgi:hypothetical protein